MSDDGLTQPELSAYLRRLAELESEAASNIGDFDSSHAPEVQVRRLQWRAFLRGRRSALLALAELVERGEIRAGLFSEPIHRLHTPRPDASMPED